ncbi:hypothetical protein [Blastochloris sulfoviridis]|uniref:Calcium-binding protein n=1 Tax=Blastochloris sulfoviridis TaxID=50712 RepID=A0A5M6HVI0_9HYPH|nr:hypothetical protein [Blastochloris sulfoviridis]KAA5599910.1 hypothetical protein F1193_11050 [Blastochloris sulfoviridis]
MASFSSKTSFNGEVFKIAGTAEGSVSMSSKYVNGDFSFTINSKKAIDADITGSLDATVIGSNAADTFDFSGASGAYIVRTRGGNDRIIDGIGNNTFDGGAGQDTFVFNQVEGPDSPDEIDTIVNYSLAEDGIELVGSQGYTVADGATDEAIITFDDGDRIVVQGAGVTKAAIEVELGIV